jgi:hypothetical protein
MAQGDAQPPVGLPGHLILPHSIRTIWARRDTSATLACDGARPIALASPGYAAGFPTLQEAEGQLLFSMGQRAIARGHFFCATITTATGPARELTESDATLQLSA